MSVIRVALPLPLPKLFDYLTSENERPAIGARVRVPFGTRKLVGIVVDTVETSDVPLKQLKHIIQLVDNTSIFTQGLWQLLTRAQRYYHYPIGEVFFQALPVKLRQGDSADPPTIQQWHLTETGKNLAPNNLKRAIRQQQAIQRLAEGPLDGAKLPDGITTNTLKSLLKKGWCRPELQTPSAQHWQPSFRTLGERLILNTEQATAVAAIRSEDNHFVAWLLAGITGSGKTEVYLTLLETILASGKQALVLVPEIGLTPQTIARFRARFHAPIDVLHSALSERERLNVWRRAMRGESAIVIGTRSAIFTPLAHPGIIIIDEEHDSSYKQQDAWRYHARDLAVMRAVQENIPIVLGSATPALESLYNASIGKYRKLLLTQRAGNASPAAQQLIDLKSTVLQAGLSTQLVKKIQQHLDANTQVLLFLNRRGYAPALLCHDCGWLAECHHCEHYYTYHQQLAVLRCHHCSNQRALPRYCPSCGSTHLMPVGNGTEQLEQRLTSLFPSVPITRIDRDTTNRKGALEQHLQAIHQGGRRILVGTQMLAKGHHFPEVTLVGLIDVDSALFSADFRATERFAQLYIQVAGRAGRAEKSGEVMLQTHHPEHTLLHLLMQQGYLAFAEQTLLERKALSLPPYAQLVLCRAEDDNNVDAAQLLTEFRRILTSYLQKNQELSILGPTPALHSKRNGRWRWQLLLQHPSRIKLHAILDHALPKLEALPIRKKVKWILDIDPQDS